MTFELLVSLLSFVHKIFLLKKERHIAWILGIVASVLSIIYFYSIGLFIFSGLEVGLTVLMAYGLLKTKTKKIDNFINIGTGIFCFMLAYLSFTGILTITEFAASIGSLLGIYFLAHNKNRTGWFIWNITHIVIIYVTLSKQQYIFSLYQTFCLIVAIVGLVRSKDTGYKL